MRILVTGGGGFVGSHLVESQLGQGHTVCALDLHTDRLTHLAKHPSLEVMTGDITDSRLLGRVMAGIDTAYHLASAHLDVSLPATRYRQVNVEATLGLLHAAREAGVRRVVHCSSAGVLGDIVGTPADELTPCQPTNVYEQTKWEGEQAALGFAEETGLQVVVARPAWVYGPRCPRTERLFRAIRKGRFVILGDGKNLRHPIYVSDAVRGLELCSQVPRATGEVYLLGGEEIVPIGTLVRLVAETAQVRLCRWHLPMWWATPLGFALETACRPLGVKPPFSRRSIDFFQKNNAYDIGKARRELDYRPLVDLRSGLATTWHWLSEGSFSECSEVKHGSF